MKGQSLSGETAGNALTFMNEKLRSSGSTFKVTKMVKVKSFPLIQTMFLFCFKIFQDLEGEVKSGQECLVTARPCYSNAS